MTDYTEDTDTTIAPFSKPVEDIAPAVDENVKPRFGARIICCVCGARPWPDDPDFPERFDLMRFNSKGRPSERPAPGDWYCGRHYPPKSP